MPDATILVSGLGPIPDIAPLTGADGSFVLDGLPDGAYIVDAKGPDGSSGSATASVANGGTAQVTIMMKPA